jgi:virginiamycin B lyase
VESLESRSLLTSITEYGPLLTSGISTQPTSITVGSNGNLWFTEDNGNQVGMINPFAATNTPTNFSTGLPTHAGLDQITSGPNGDVFFTETNPSANAIGMIDPTQPNTQTIQNFGTSAGMTAVSGPTGVASAGGDVWFIQSLSDQIGRLDPTTGKITEHPAPSGLISPNGLSRLNSRMVLGPDGNLWFTEYGAIGIFNPNTGTLVKEVTLPRGSLEQPQGIALGPDGNVWYTAGVLNAAESGFVSFAVGVISATANPSTDHVLQEVPIASATKPFGITSGPDNQIWFTVTSGSAAGTIDAIDPTTRTLTEKLTIPTNIISTPNPVAIVGGPDGNLWFADNAGAVGVVSTNVHFVVTTPPPSPVTAGKSFGLVITAELGSGTTDTGFNGNVTLFLNGNPAVTVSAAKGVASFNGLMLDGAGAYAYVAASGASNAPAAVTGSLNVIAAPATQLVVTTPPAGGLFINGAFGFTVAAKDQFGNVDTNFSGTVTATLGTNPGGSGTVLSGPTSVAVTPASATPGLAVFSGLSLNNAGNGYTLNISSSPSRKGTTVGPFDVSGTPPTPPTPPTIISAAPVFHQNLKKNGKPKGKPVLVGYTINFSTAMDTTALSNSNNYVFDIFVIKKEKLPGHKRKVAVPVPTPIGFQVMSFTSTSVTLAFTGKQKFSKGGQIVLEASGIDDAAGVFLTQNGVLSIANGGKSIGVTTS